MMHPPLQMDEVILERRRPMLKVFGVKILFIFCVWLCLFTFPLIPSIIAAFASLSANGLVYVAGVLGSAALSTLFYMFIFNDFKGWARNSGDVWTITNQRIMLYSAAEGTFGETSWDEVRSVHIHYFWSLRVRLNNGQAILMQYIGYKRQLHNLMRGQVLDAQIYSARATT